jgi:hypothetical protein
MLLKRWIEACDRLHGGSCRLLPIQYRPDDQIPDWLIDVQDACVVEGRQAHRYVALSYVWAGNQGPEYATLINANLPRLRKPGSLNHISIPPVAEQAMDLVKTVGERYLWTDSLCNIQDGHQIRMQVERMNHVYSGAYFSVLTASSPPGLYGTAPPRTSKSYRWGNDAIEQHYGQLFESNWNKRGWTFQEHILSRRAVAFVDGNMFWDCQKSVWDRDRLSLDLEMAGNANSTSKSRFREMAHGMFSTPWPNFRVYTELVCPYNYRDLTKTSCRRSLES